jgi:phosphatidylglycerol lysyltransferase
VPARRGWLIEQFVRSPDAPNGTVELLIDTAVRRLAAEGAGYVTLGLAPLADRAHADPPGTPPLWLRLLLGWMRAHGRRFYDFRGLESFKAKFSPMRWEPVYAIVDRARIMPRMTWAIAAAFTGGAPASVFVRALARAVRQEAVWMLSAARGAPAARRDARGAGASGPRARSPR